MADCRSQSRCGPTRYSGDAERETRRSGSVKLGFARIRRESCVTDNHGPDPDRTPQVAANPPTAPRIFRPTEAVTEQVASTPDEEATEVVPMPSSNAAALVESTQRFGAGTVYGGDGTGQGTPPQGAVRPAEQAQRIYKVAPQEQVPLPRILPTTASDTNSTPASTSPTFGSGIPKWASGIPDVNIYVALTMVLAVIFPPLAIPVGHVTRTQVIASGGQGESLVRAGLLLAYVSLGIFMLLLVISGIAAMI